jgi:hypothetical protein
LAERLALCLCATANPDRCAQPRHGMHREEESRAREQKSKPVAGRAEQNNSVVDPLGVVRVSAVAAVATLWPADPLRPRNRHRNVNAAVVSGHWSRFPTRNHHDEAQRISFASDQPWSTGVLLPQAAARTARPSLVARMAWPR